MMYLWLPVKELIKLAVSLFPCIEIAASFRPAIQPSVRDSREVMSWAERFRPITWTKKLDASDDENLKFAARSSTI